MQPDRSLIHFLDTTSCSDLDALFSSARMSARKAQNATAPLVHHLSDPFVLLLLLLIASQVDQLGDRSANGGLENTQEPIPAVRDFDEIWGYWKIGDWCISGVLWIE